MNELPNHSSYWMGKFQEAATERNSVCLELGRLMQTNTELTEQLRVAEDALIRHGYRKSCDIPACNCGDQWNHGGHAAARLRELGEELSDLTQGRTILDAVRLLRALLDNPAEPGA